MAATNQWQTFRRRDADVLKSLRAVEQAYGQGAANLVIRIAEGQGNTINVLLASAESDERVQRLVAINEPVAHLIHARLEGATYVEVVRPNDSHADTVRVSFDPQTDPTKTLLLLPAVRAQFPHTLTTESIERTLGPELAQFYSAREAGLARMEQVAQDLIERTDAYRTSLAQKADDREQQRAVAFDARRAELDAEYRQKQQEIEARQKELDVFKASLDDRQSRHARRALRQELQKILEGHSKQFSLTSDTVRKRRVIHGLFVALALAALAYVGFTISETWAGETFDAAHGIRLTLGAASFVGVLLLYIRWADQWFRQHADEEFRLKRMGLDVDRASWVVEVAMEWQHENKQPIPEELLDQLSKGLFSANESSGPVRHPMEELASAVLSGASNLRLDVPGLGEVTVGARGARKLAKKIEDAQRRR